jgi:hypothetical protein
MYIKSCQKYYTKGEQKCDKITTEITIEILIIHIQIYNKVNNKRKLKVKLLYCQLAHGQQFVDNVQQR